MKDEWELTVGVHSLNRRNRWELVDEILEAQTRTMDLLKDGQLGREPLVLASFSSNRKDMEDVRLLTEASPELI